MLRSRSLFFVTFVTALGCSRSRPAPPAVDAGPFAPARVETVAPSGPPADASAKRSEADASVPASRPRCNDPARVVQLGTVKEPASFEGELLVAGNQALDPETLTPRPRPRTKRPPVPDQYEYRRQGRYYDAAGGVGLLESETGEVQVVDLASRRGLLTIESCAPGGAINILLSGTGRFVVCWSNRFGAVVTPVRGKRDDAIAWGDLGGQVSGLELAPNDTYAVALADLAWADRKERKNAQWFAIDPPPSLAPVTRPPRNLAPIPYEWQPPESPGEPRRRWPREVSLAFCGDGDIFALVIGGKLIVFRGADGERLAEAPVLAGGDLSFSGSGRYVSQTRGKATTVFRLEP
jgi:hypothetical protein